VKYLEKIWKTKTLTNRGPFHQQLEQELCDYLGVKYCSLFSNGTIALMIGLKALDVQGEVITTPYSFVATSHALDWIGINPVFCDIEEERLNIDHRKIQQLITPQTTAILPVHVYGHPCDMEKIGELGRNYNLRIVYDAAHAFGVKNRQDSILNYGDLSILSFHATKIFNTFEGGAIITDNLELKRKIELLRNFGIADETTVAGPGINGKMNELQAAFGLLQLKTIDIEISKRRRVANLYRKKLREIKGIRCYEDIEGVTLNNSYFPIRIDQSNFGVSRDQVYDELKKRNIYARRYFYPLISHFPLYDQLESSSPANLPIAEKVAHEILCLPIFADLDLEIASSIADVIIDLGKV